MKSNRTSIFPFQVAPMLLWVSIALGLAGCGNDLATVTGIVTVDGEPLRGGSGVKATVVFSPISPEGANAVGLLNERGEYHLSTGSQRGVKPGEYRVAFTATEIIPPQNPDGTPTGRRISDPKYANAQTSGLEFTVEPGKNEYNLSLDSLPSNARGRNR